MRLIKFLGILLLLFFLSCDDQETGGQSSPIDTSGIKAQVATPTKKKPNSQSIEDIEKNGQVVSTTTFNQDVIAAQKENAAWTKSPILVALKFGGENMESRKKTIDLEAPNGEAMDKFLVTITEDGFLDDSIKGSMLILRMEQKDNLWQIQKATRAWNCYRGHKEFNAKPCN